MTGKRGDDGRVCLCDRHDGTCAGLAVRRLSRERVRELAEEIWTASSGDLPPSRPAPDPRPSRAGAPAQTASARCRERERGSWRLRFPPSAEARRWQRQAAAQRRTAAMLAR